jgi:hypothetical protein
VPRSGRNFDAFQQGAGTAPEATLYVCAHCGYSSDNRRHFKSHEDGKTCSTGHYEDKEGQIKRARNPYAHR